MTEPTFLYIGIARAGSTWLFEALRYHPEVFVPPAKDIYFFDKQYGKGLEWYLSFFAKAGDARAVGELSHDYYYSEEAPARIKADLPHVKLICCLREPLDRLRSGYSYDRTAGTESSTTLEEYIERPEIQRQLDYVACLQPYFNLFGPDRVRVVFYEDLKTDPAGFIRAIYSFLDVNPDYKPPMLHQRVNPARDARNPALANRAYRVAQVFRNLGMANVVGRIKQNTLVNKVLYQQRNTGGGEPIEVPPELAARLRAQNGALEVLIGRSLPKSWYG